MGILMNLEILHFVFEGTSSLERYAHEGPSTVFFGLSPLKSVRPEHEGSSSFFEGLPDPDTKRSPSIRTSFFEDLNTFEPDEPFQIQSGLCFIQNTWRCT